MPVATRIRSTGICPGCGARVGRRARFCPTCGARQVPDTVPAAPLDRAYESDEPDRSATVMVLLVLVVAAVLLLVAGWLVGRVSAALDAEDAAAAVGDAHRPAAAVADAPDDRITR